MIYSKSHNVCLYDTSPEIERFLSHVDVKQGKVIVPCSLKNMQTLAALGYDALSPMINEYDWPSCKEKVLYPYEHQKHMSAFITLHPRCFVLSDMGTGKTLSALWAYDYLMRVGEAKKCLIVAPLSTLRRVWEDEIFTHFLSNRRCLVLHGSAKRRYELVQQDSDYYILNHDGLAVGHKRGKTGLELGDLGKYIQENSDFNAVIVDEGSAFKVSGTLRYKVLSKILTGKKYVTWMTGTPVPNAPTDAYPQARLVRKEYHEAFTSFKQRTMKQVTPFKWVPLPDGYDKAAEILQPSIRYSRDECLDLPEVVFETRECELSETQKKAYDTLRKECQVTFESGVVTAVHEGALRQKLIQVACGAIYGQEDVTHKIGCEDRIKVLREIIEEAGHKILIFAPLTSVVEMLYSELKQDYSVEKVNGEVNPKQRGEIFKSFQEETNPRIIVAHPGTMAHGLTLTRASTTVWFAPIDQPEIYQQANARMDRPGQRNRMLIVRIAATPVEREIYKRLDNKSSMQGIMLDLIKGE